VPVPNLPTTTGNAALPMVDVPATRRMLFLIGFLSLFLELACIRWFAAYVIFLQFFTNIILIACFLGLALGCLCARQPTEWMKYFPGLTLGSIGLALGMALLYLLWEGFVIDVGSQRKAPQEVFFGTEYRDVDLAQFVIPIECIAAVFFVFLILMFLGFGQLLGRGFEKDPNRVAAYTCNLGGSLAGILGFALLALAHTPPIVWFLIGFVGVGYVLKQTGQLTRTSVLLLTITALLILLVDILPSGPYRSFWSPYYRILYNQSKQDIHVNNIFHQTMLPSEHDALYSLIHLLQRDAGGSPFADVLIIGAGTGNDLAHSLRLGAQRVDAVEIDPVIQGLGARYHPAHPYQDPRVQVHLDDGRNFLRRTDQTYDLVVYALVDSLLLHSSYSNIRLESFLFTEEAFRDVKQVLKPNGVFVSYNFFRQGWIVQRIARMFNTVFGQEPLIISLPYMQEIRADNERPLSSLTMVIAGHTRPIVDAFAQHQHFWLNHTVSLHNTRHAFGSRPVAAADDDPSRWEMIAPTTVVDANEPLVLSTDDWPFLYLRAPMIPALSLRSAALLAVLGGILLYWLAPGHTLALNGRMFFLGAAFLLLETKAVVSLALVFGSTWVVNALVFAAILVMLLGANLYVLQVRRPHLMWHYAALLLTLGLNALIPLHVFLAGNVLWKYIAPCVLVMLPMLFAGVVFAVSFRTSTQPGLDFGANIAGAVVGGFTEYLSMWLGFRSLLWIAIVFYGLSALCRRRTAA
jgi:SAM-dependent methyltransferase